MTKKRGEIRLMPTKMITFACREHTHRLCCCLLLCCFKSGVILCSVHTHTQLRTDLCHHPNHHHHLQISSAPSPQSAHLLHDSSRSVYLAKRYRSAENKTAGIPRMSWFSSQWNRWANNGPNGSSRRGDGPIRRIEVVWGRER